MKRNVKIYSKWSKKILIKIQGLTGTSKIKRINKMLNRNGEIIGYQDQPDRLIEYNIQELFRNERSELVQQKDETNNGPDVTRILIEI